MRKYRDLTIRERILIFNILFFTAMLVIFMFLFFEVRRSTEETTIAAERLLMGQTVNTIELVSEEAGTIADSIASQPLLYRMVNTQDLDRFLEENDTAVYARDFFSEIETVEKSEMLSGIRIYLSPEYDKVGQAYSFSEVFRPISEVRSAYWYGIFAGRPLLYAQF
ncbi:MAG: hypothetical protein IJ873_03895, partial [Lachnospiraceae bacterium]|nr:hypothetical protein [Lachnospiraceae bacterium]